MRRPTLAEEGGNYSVATCRKTFSTCFAQITTSFMIRTTNVTITTVNSAPNTTEGRTSNIAWRFVVTVITSHQKRSNHERERTERTPARDANTR